MEVEEGKEGEMGGGEDTRHTNPILLPVPLRPVSLKEPYTCYMST